MIFLTTRSGNMREGGQAQYQHNTSPLTGIYNIPNDFVAFHTFLVQTHSDGSPCAVHALPCFHLGLPFRAHQVIVWSFCPGASLRPPLELTHDPGTSCLPPRFLMDSLLVCIHGCSSTRLVTSRARRVTRMSMWPWGSNTCARGHCHGAMKNFFLFITLSHGF